MNSATPLVSARQRREAAAEKYRPAAVRLLLIAEAPPSAEERYFYFPDVQQHDWLFRGVSQALTGEAPTRAGKEKVLTELKRMGVFLIDLKLDPIDGSPLEQYVPGLVSRCKALAPVAIILIKASVFDAAYHALKATGLPVIDKRIPFPSSGQQGNFRRLFAEALTGIHLARQVA